MTTVQTMGYGVFAPDNLPPDSRDKFRLVVATAWVSARNCVTRIIDPELVANPGWDILLDLFISGMRDQPAFVCGLCLASHVPQTTALRWIGNLETRGLAHRTPDTRDRRRSIVQLTELGLEKVRAVLDAASDSDRKLGIGRLQTAQ
ncbi:winged helix DNA-binding protein [Sphingomonas panacisoli]|uniref:Winged helix DNA-binding protein n=1 Tax=Sphingomonas panacisoli TaxID=1813879 RepID=A0A5B8LIT2_9SPHN|nr:winged helix DNA-binding protein [Sphingomonas panacisoli]QDZ08001.1 winged helix DNA-binding protein [Sphingomonas panacisoli]